MALDLYKMINPIEHSKNKELADKYKIEPYVIAADIYANKDMYGQGGWSWYTGAAGWYFVCLFKYILGVKIESNIMSFEPHIPENWSFFRIKYKYKKSIYNIIIRNLSGKSGAVYKVKINGVDAKNKKLFLYDDGNTYEVEVFI